MHGPQYGSANFCPFSNFNLYEGVSGTVCGIPPLKVKCSPLKIIYYVVIGNCIHILSTVTKSLKVVIRPYNVCYFVFSAWSKFCHIVSNNHDLLSTCDP